MRISIICPIGNLEKFGYHHIVNIVLRSFSLLVERVIAISSSRVSRIGCEAAKIRLIFPTSTWFDLDESDNELYSMVKLMDNANSGLDILDFVSP